jgi:kynurenine formamidase
MLVERGIPIMEMLDLEAPARDGIHAFLFIALPLKIVGGTGSPIRPVAVAWAGPGKDRAAR